MPCYQMNMISSEFNVSNLDYLQMTLRRMGMQYSINTTGTVIWFGEIKLNLTRKTAELPSDTQNILNAVKVEYARTCIEQVAKKKRWIVKNVAKNKLKLKRY